jgi:Arc/MetJ-type ribon-helix-helix transcriptional regulator
MQVRLSAPLQAFVRQLVAEGQFSSTDEVIAAALSTFAKAELKRDVKLGLKDVREGRVSDWDLEEMKRDLLRRVKQRRTTKAS